MQDQDTHVASLEITGLRSPMDPNQILLYARSSDDWIRRRFNDLRTLKGWRLDEREAARNDIEARRVVKSGPVGRGWVGSGGFFGLQKGDVVVRGARELQLTITWCLDPVPTSPTGP